MRQKIIVILGQTATGKSNLAIRIARKVGGEIISADSRQIYKNLNIGTGKITKKEMRGIRHHLLDVANPQNQFTVAEYKKLAEEKIEEIFIRRKVPIICGGTGFFIDAITKGVVFPKVSPNYLLRKKLASVSDHVLMLKLQKLDPERAKNIDQYNRVRLIRAIEIAKTLGKVPKIIEVKPTYQFVKIGLSLPIEKLKKKIEQRLMARIKMGMLNEVKKLHQRGLSWKRMKELGLEYKFTALYLQNKITKQELTKQLKTAIIQYAKRQMTWFKRDQEIKWFSLTEYKKIEKYIRKKL